MKRFLSVFVLLAFMFCISASAFAAAQKPPAGPAKEPEPPKIKDSGNLLDDITQEGSGAALGEGYGLSRAAGSGLRLTYDAIGAYGYFWGEFEPIDVSSFRFANVEFDMRASLFTPEIKIEFKEKRATENVKFVLSLSRNELKRRKGKISCAIPPNMGFVNIFAVVVEPHRFVRIEDKEAFIKLADRIIAGTDEQIGIKDSGAFELYKEFQKGSIVIRSISLSERPCFSMGGRAETGQQFVAYEDLDGKGEPYLQVIFGELADYGWTTIPVRLTNMGPGGVDLNTISAINVTFKGLRDKMRPPWFRIELVGKGKTKAHLVISRDEFTDYDDWVTVFFGRSRWGGIEEGEQLGIVDFIDVVVAPGEDVKKGVALKPEDFSGAFAIKTIEFTPKKSEIENSAESE